ncbi:MAG: hypothetical protein ACI8YP_002152 [Algoriphagus sp.]
MKKRNLLCTEMYKYILRIILSFCLLPLVGYSLANPSVAVVAPNTQVLFSGEQAQESKLQSAPEFDETNQIQTSAPYVIEGNSKAILVERQETEEETRHDNYSISLNKVQNTYFKNFILLENFVLKVNFREFAKSLFLFSEPFRLHLLIQVFNI